MNTGSFLFAVLALAAIPAGVAHGSPSHHEPHVADVHYPDAPARGEPVHVEATLVNATNITDVRLIYCRVQHYACGPALGMTGDADGRRQATIPWTSRFFDGVTTVGVRIEMEFEDGRLAHSPVAHFPSRPPDLPPEGDTYYYYTLPRESPALAPALILVALGVIVWVMRR